MMNLKKGYRILLLLMFLSILSTSVLLVLSPDTVPVHYNLAGEVNRMGSKYEYLIFPAEAVLIGAFFGWMGKKFGKDPTEEKALVICGICVLAVLGLLGIYFQTAAIFYDPAAGGLQLPVIRLTVMGIGVMFVILGNLMPKARRNRFYGLRTVWSLSDDGVWQKSQRFAGITATVCGTLMILLAAFLEGLACLVMSMVLVSLWLTGAVLMSFLYSRSKEK